MSKTIQNPKKHTPPAEPTPQQKVIEVLTRCGPYSLLQARAELQGLTDDELTSLVKIYDKLERAHEEPQGELVTAVLGKIEDRTRRQRKRHKQKESQQRAKDETPQENEPPAAEGTEASPGK